MNHWSMAKPNLTSLCTVLLNFAPDQLGRKRIYHYKRKFKYCPNIYCGHIAYLFTTVIEPKHNGVKLLFCSIWAAHSIFSRKTNPEFRIFIEFFDPSNQSFLSICFVFFVKTILFDMKLVKIRNWPFVKVWVGYLNSYLYSCVFMRYGSFLLVLNILVHMYLFMKN